MSADLRERAMFDRLHAKARSENALALFFGLLAVPFFLTLVLHDKIYIGPRSMVLVLGVFMLLLPALAAKGFAAQRPGVLYPLSILGVTAGAWLGSAKLWVAALAAVAAGLACWLFYRLKDNTNWEPRLMPAAVDKARREAGLTGNEGK